MICLICRQAEIVDGLTSITFECGEMKFIVNNLPARVCPHCGEAYVEQGVAERLLRSAEERFRSGEVEDVREYDGL